MAYSHCMGSKKGSAKKPAQGELELIDRIRSRVAGKGLGRGAELRVGIGDDCALLRLKVGEELAVTTDLALDGRHFRLDWHPAESVGHRTLARGLSDLAAMGARPVAAFLSLGLPAELAKSKGGEAPWVDRFYDGLLGLAEAHKTPLAGGDLSESPLALADIVLLGAVPRGKALLRSGAKAGDQLYVTGRLGGAALGLALLTANEGKRRRPLDPGAETALGPHLYPQPRVEQGQFLSKRRLATAAMDLSDGLSMDLPRMCAESGVAAEVEAELIPCFAGATLDQALHGGEDYELLFTARAGARIPRSIGGVPVTRIGEMVARRKARPTLSLICAGKRQALSAGGWEHFAGC